MKRDANNDFIKTLRPLFVLYSVKQEKRMAAESKNITIPLS